MVEKIQKKKTTTKQATKTARVKSGLTAPLINIKGEEVGTIDLPVEIFGAPGSDRLLALYVRVYLANQRQGTRSVKTRSEVVGSTRKIYRQKGTGRARHGASKAPIFVGGGIAFGPSPKDFSLKLNKKQRRRAFLYALSKRFKARDITFIDGLTSVEPKTKIFSQVLKDLKFADSKNVLIVHGEGDMTNLVRAARNIRNVEIKQSNSLNAYDVSRGGRIIFGKEVVDYLVTHFTKKNSNEN